MLTITIALVCIHVFSVIGMGAMIYEYIHINGKHKRLVEALAHEAFTPKHSFLHEGKILIAIYILFTITITIASSMLFFHIHVTHAG